jgi:hypothetical protein
MGARPLAAAERAEPTRVPRLRPPQESAPRIRVLRKCACGGGASCKCGDQAQAAPDRETVAMLARYAGNSAVTGLLQRDEAKTAKKSSKLDDKAAAIVKAAQDTSVDESKRGVEAVKSIISTYFSGDAGLVKEVIWKSSQGGLNTESVGKGKDTQGKITVGHSFLQQTTESGISRRVLQVDHELEHVRQHRAGMGGANRQDEREFLAFQREALEPEFAGTGRVGHSTRVKVIDSALGYFYCLSEDNQKKYADKKEALLTEREKHNGKAGNDKTDPPTTCARAND